MGSENNFERCQPSLKSSVFDVVELCSYLFPSLHSDSRNLKHNSLKLQSSRVNSGSARPLVPCLAESLLIHSLCGSAGESVSQLWCCHPNGQLNYSPSGWCDECPGVKWSSVVWIILLTTCSYILLFKQGFIHTLTHIYIHTYTLPPTPKDTH